MINRHSCQYSWCKLWIDCIYNSAALSFHSIVLADCMVCLAEQACISSWSSASNPQLPGAVVPITNRQAPSLTLRMYWAVPNHQHYSPIDGLAFPLEIVKCDRTALRTLGERPRWFLWGGAEWDYPWVGRGCVWVIMISERWILFGWLSHVLTLGRSTMSTIKYTTFIPLALYHNCYLPFRSIPTLSLIVPAVDMRGQTSGWTWNREG